MATKKDDKLAPKPKTGIKTKTQSETESSEAVKKDSSILIKTAETIGGILGKVAGTAHNIRAGKKVSASPGSDPEADQELPKELAPAKTPRQLKAKPEPNPKQPAKAKTTKTKSNKKTPE